MFRKPNPVLFELALKKAGLSADDVWFCGDNTIADIEGSAAVGIFSVWYEDMTMNNPRRERNSSIAPICDHLCIHDWNDLIKILEDLA